MSQGGGGSVYRGRGLHLGEGCLLLEEGSAFRGRESTSASKEGGQHLAEGCLLQGSGSASRGSAFGGRGSGSRGIRHTSSPLSHPIRSYLGYYGIWSTSERYASYWKAFLF